MVRKRARGRTLALWAVACRLSWTAQASSLHGTSSSHQDGTVCCARQARRSLQGPSLIDRASVSRRAVFSGRSNSYQSSCGLTALASRLLGHRAFPIDAMFFDKHAGANWTVPGHQDRLFPVSDDSSGKRRTRDGIAYAEPDRDTLADLLALRIHFDATDADTGALQVVPASHRNGVLTTAQILEVPVQRYVPCPAGPGDVLAMKPLLLHRSSPSKGTAQRRVLHVVYATRDPADGIRWRRSHPKGAPCRSF